MYKKLLLSMLIVILMIFMTACGTDGTETSKKNNSDAPVIESITQESGTGGDVIDIYVNYDASKFNKDDFKVLIDGELIELSTKYLSGKQFEFSLPLNLEAGKKSIAVELGGKKSNEVEFEILTPEITSIDMSEISFLYTDESLVTISGNNLGFSKDKIKVTLNDEELDIDTVYKTGIKVKIQKGVESGDIVVHLNGKKMKTFSIIIKET